jgi:hypothetical protein
MATAKEVAKWMADKIQEEEWYPQELFAGEIEDLFGDEFTYVNENGNRAIDKKVLAEFRKLTKDTVVWERGERRWRLREDYDESGKRQAD